MNIKINVLTEAGGLAEYLIHDSVDPRLDTVYLIKEYGDGTRRAFNRAYELIGAVPMTDEEFRSLGPLVIRTAPGYTGGDHLEGDAYWLELNNATRERYKVWIKQQWREHRERQE